MTSRALLVIVLSACTYNARFEDCAVHCTTDVGCPDSLQCGTEGLCRTPGETETCAAVLGTFPSCVGLAATCGPNADEDCCAATSIPGGTFFRSYDVASDGMYPSMSYPATVSSFRLDRFEVTVGRFRKFVEAGMGTRANPPPAGAGARALNSAPDQGGWDASWNVILTADTSALAAAVKCNAYKAWTDSPDDNEELPINCITWYEAFAFCVWDGGFLLTEAEWNYVAAGGAEQRAYPWSSPAGATAIDCSYANYKEGTSYCVNPPNGSVSRVGSTSPRGDSKWSQSDLAGNVWEWTLDWYQGPYENPCNDCTETAEASYRIIRGGSFYDGSNLRTAVRNYSTTPVIRVGNIGVRCARAP